MQPVDTLLRQAVEDGTIPGAVLCIARRGEVVWHQAYGAAALTPCWRPMQRHTLFDIASLTKVVATTSLLLVAHHQGICHLDDCLQRFFPATTGTVLGTVTVRQLLAHTGGLPAWQPLYQELPAAGPVSREAARARQQQAVQAILRLPLAYAPGTRAVYSDLGFILLGVLIEAQFRQSLAVLFQQYVAEPCGLRATAYRPLYAPGPLPDDPAAYAATEACPWRGRILVGEVHDENAWALGGVAGHAGLFATAYDLWHFVHALLEAAAGRRLWLPAPLLRGSWQRHPMPPDTTRALGWDTPTPGQSTAGDHFSRHSIGHLGFTGSSIWIDLEHQVTVILCTNRIHPTRQAAGITRLRPAVHNLTMRALGVCRS